MVGGLSEINFIISLLFVVLYGLVIAMAFLVNPFLFFYYEEKQEEEPMAIVMKN